MARHAPVPPQLPALLSCLLQDRAIKEGADIMFVRSPVDSSLSLSLQRSSLVRDRDRDRDRERPTLTL